MAIEEVIFKHKQGWGLISDTELEVVSRLGNHAEPIRLGNVDLLPGLKTDLDGFFCRELLYLGLIDEKSQLFLSETKEAKKLCFYIGEEDGKVYFQIVAWIAENKFFMFYMHNGGRDFNFKNNKWK